MTKLKPLHNSKFETENPTCAGCGHRIYHTETGQIYCEKGCRCNMAGCMEDRGISLRSPEQ